MKYLSNDEVSTPTEEDSVKRASCTDEDFIASWQGNDNVEAVATLLGMKPASIEQRARNMRKHGVPLKRYAAKARTVKDEAYWARMAALAEAANEDDEVDTNA